jgi:hypothetical protein
MNIGEATTGSRKAAKKPLATALDPRRRAMFGSEPRVKSAFDTISPSSTGKFAR